MQPIDPLSMFCSFSNFKGAFTVYKSIGLKTNIKFMKDKDLKLIKNSHSHVLQKHGFKKITLLSNRLLIVSFQLFRVEPSSASQ